MGYPTKLQCIQRQDSQQFYINFPTPLAQALDFQKGERLERVKGPHGFVNQKAFTVQIEVTPHRLVQKVRVGNEWKVLDTFAEPGRDFTQGRFGFLIQGNDEIAITDFEFLPK